MKTAVKEKSQIEKIDNSCDNYKEVYNSNDIKFVKLGDWLEKESKTFLKETITKKETFKKIERGQIIKVNFGVNIGSELCYTHFAIVITKNDSIYSDIITVIPITSKKGNNRLSLGKLLNKAYPNSLKYNLNCYANLTQIKTISKSRIFLNQKHYICNSSILDKIDKALIEMYTK